MNIYKKFDAILATKTKWPVSTIRTFIKLTDGQYWAARLYRYKNGKNMTFWISKFGDKYNNYEEEYLNGKKEIDAKLKWLKDNGFVEISNKQLRVPDLERASNLDDISMPAYIEEATQATLASAEDVLLRLEAFAMAEKIDEFNNEKDYRYRAAYQISEGFFATKKTLADCRKLLTQILELEVSDELVDYINKINDKIRQIYIVLPHCPKLAEDHRLETGIKPDFIPERDLYIDPNSSNPKADAERLAKTMDEEISAEEARTESIYSIIVRPEIPPDKESILETINGINVRISDKDDELEETVKNLMGNQFELRYANCWYVSNPESEEAYNKAMQSLRSKDKKKEILLWHGSKTANWKNIISDGLKIIERASHGRMFGNGNYFAPDVDKAIGYTSVDGSRWSHGNSAAGFIAIFKVRVGRSLEIDNKPELKEIKKKGIEQYVAKKGFDSVLGRANNGFLKKDEYCVYNENQSTIYALVEVKKVEKND